MTNCEKKYLILGLPESGKTTFLAAMWFYTRHASQDEGLTVEVLPLEREYLNSISDEWLKGNKQKHTSGTSIIDIRLKLIDPCTKSTSELFIPDLSGEIFINHWADRSWSDDFNDLAIDATGVLLFLHPDQNLGPLTISEVNAGEIALGNEDDDTSEEIIDNEVKEFDPLRVPQQVILVDQLQCLVGQPCYHEKLKLSIIISAWDTVDNPKTLPIEWIKKHAPLLFQFIISNQDVLDVQTFGVSAQGCDFANSAERNEVISLVNPIDRIKVFDGKSESHNITIPVHWMM